MAPESLKYYDLSDTIGPGGGVQLNDTDAKARGLDPADGQEIGEDGRPVKSKTPRKATAKTPPANKADDAANKAQSTTGLTPGS